MCVYNFISILLIFDKFISIKKKDHHSSVDLIPSEESNLSFSLPFLLIRMIFLIFDVEIILFI